MQQSSFVIFKLSLPSVATQTQKYFCLKITFKDLKRKKLIGAKLVEHSMVTSFLVRVQLCQYLSNGLNDGEIVGTFTFNRYQVKIFLFLHFSIPEMFQRCLIRFMLLQTLTTEIVLLKHHISNTQRYKNLVDIYMIKNRPHANF